MGNDKKNTNLEGPPTEQYLEMLQSTYPVLEPVVSDMIQALQLPQGSHGLDVGCGIGQAVLSLAEAVGPNGYVTGLDISPEFLEYAKELAQEAGLKEQVTFKQGDFNKLPFDDNTFDWVWSKDCVGYQVDESRHALKELVRVVNPGGTVIIILWSSQMFLPGYPILEAHLNATRPGIAPFEKGMKPELHFFRLLSHLREVGLKERSIKTFVGDVHAPFSDAVRNALVLFFAMRWPDVESELSKEDWAEYQRLCEPGSPDLILNSSDYYAFFTYSLFRGKAPKKE
jgi:demethylmenaquinone methyltransferase/2-methoxy-6-polyprenyl-1,4-benzoquinol methylase